MRILAIETSMDETAAAVVEKLPGGLVKVVAETRETSEKKHVKTGGVVPEVAAREQLRSIIPVVGEVFAKVTSNKQQLSNSKVQTWGKKNIDAVAVTVGPGMIGSLLVGVESAKALSLAWRKPLIGVNHLRAHLYANFVGEGDKTQPPTNKQGIRNKEQTSRKPVPEFPAVGLVVSGGNTILVLMRSHDEMELLGSTRDDAAGECFDKCSRLLKLGYPGGPAIEKAASEFSSSNFQFSNKLQAPNSKLKLPRPLINDESYDFSFSGIKAAVSRLMNNEQETVNNEIQKMIAYELQEAVVEVLMAKVIRAVEEFKPKSVLLGGGVGANTRLRESLNVQCSMFNVQMFVPEKKFCTDNAVMIGAAACYLNTPLPAEKVKADPSLEIVW